MLLGKNRKVWILLLCLIALTAAGLYFWKYTSPETPVPFGAYRGYNILLVTIDTLRADHLPLYGYQKVETPYLDRLGAESIVFEDAISHVPLTLPSHVTILTGLLPPDSGVRDNSGFFLKPEIHTLAEILKSAGYDTAAFVSAFVVDSMWGIDQGFDTYFDDFPGEGDVERRAGVTAAQAQAWLGQTRTKPFFCWIHFYDPHDPYDPPEPYRSKYASLPYDGEIAYTDQSLGKILTSLRESGAIQRTIVLVTSDHGESLGEHQEYGHSLFIYNVTQHVPLLIYLPGQKPRRVNGPVGLIDIPPTLLSLIGRDRDAAMSGVSLIAQMSQEVQEKRPVYSESWYSRLHFGWSPLRSLTTGDYRYIEAPTPELYDRIKDPDDLDNIAAETPKVLKAFRKQMNQFSKQGSALASPRKLDPETEEKLRSLGYLSGGTQRNEKDREVDPKDRIQFFQNHQDALVEIKRREYKKALTLLEPMLQQEPGLVDVQLSAGIAYSATGNYARAVECYQKALSLRPGYREAISNLAATYEKLGDLDNAMVSYREMLKDPGRKGFASMRLADLYRKTGQDQTANHFFEEARSWFQEKLNKSMDPGVRSHLYFQLAELHLQAGSTSDSEMLLRNAIQEDPKKPLLHLNLALLLEQRKDVSGAISEYEKELEVSPSLGVVFLNLGRLYQDTGRSGEAEFCFRKYRELQSQQEGGAR